MKFIIFFVCLNSSLLTLKLIEISQQFLERLIPFLKSIFMAQRPPPPSGAGASHYRVFAIKLRHTTLGRTPLDEWSARRRDLYLTTHNTNNRQTSFFHIQTVHLHKYQSFFSPTDAQLDNIKNDFKFALKLTLKSSYMFRCETSLSGSALFEPC